MCGQHSHMVVTGNDNSARAHSPSNRCQHDNEQHFSVVHPLTIAEQRQPAETPIGSAAATAAVTPPEPEIGAKSTKNTPHHQNYRVNANPLQPPPGSCQRHPSRSTSRTRPFRSVCIDRSQESFGAADERCRDPWKVRLVGHDTAAQETTLKFGMNDLEKRDRTHIAVDASRACATWCRREVPAFIDCTASLSTICPPCAGSGDPGRDAAPNLPSHCHDARSHRCSSPMRTRNRKPRRPIKRLGVVAEPDRCGQCTSTVSRTIRKTSHPQFHVLSLTSRLHGCPDDLA